GEEISIPIELKPKENSIQAIAGTMLALLGGNSWLGLLLVLAIIVIALFLLAYGSRKQKNILLIPKHSEVKS
ncbi:MAG: hypothetical protein PHH08_01950, partial [Candidatus ainarchaeum sp.]|nr:hypothetical protein [Candidatus ainarchaeum sp.]